MKQPTLVFDNCDFDLKLTDTEIKTTEERAIVLYIFNFRIITLPSQSHIII